MASSLARPSRAFPTAQFHLTSLLYTACTNVDFVASNTSSDPVSDKASPRFPPKTGCVPFNSRSMHIGVQHFGCKCRNPSFPPKRGMCPSLLVLCTSGYSGLAANIGMSRPILTTDLGEWFPGWSNNLRDTAWLRFDSINKDALHPRMNPAMHEDEQERGGLFPSSPMLFDVALSY